MLCDPVGTEELERSGDNEMGAAAEPIGGDGSGGFRLLSLRYWYNPQRGPLPPLMESRSLYQMHSLMNTIRF